MLRRAVCCLWLLPLGLTGCGDNGTFVEPQPYQPAEPEPLACLPNLDGRIESAELQTALGVPVSTLVSPAGETRAVDVVGEVDAGGHRVWDWGADYASDQLARIQAKALSGHWYATEFPTGDFVVPFDAAGRVESIYSRDDDGLYLLGLASAEEHPPEGQTLLAYDRPVAVLRFPLEVGAEWVSTAEIANGLFRDLPYAGRDTYRVVVDAAGQLVLPDLTFTQALRVRTETVVEPAVGASTAQRQVSFLFECFGEVARATSLVDEPLEDFSSALEVRRLGLVP